MSRRALALAVAVAAAAGCGKRGDQHRPVEIQRQPPITPRTTGDAIEYTVSFPAPQTHYAEVTAVMPTGGAGAVDLMMAVWTPGSYLVREFERNVEGLTAATTAGDPLAVTKTRKNRWHVTTGGGKRVVIRYRLYARELTVRTDFIDADMALLNGAATFITLVGGLGRAHDVAIDKPKGWSTIVTPLPPAPGGDADRYLAPDYDTLVDSPITIGNPAVHEFEVEGVEHTLADFGEDGIFDGERAAADLRDLVATETQTWGVIPYPHYTFFNVLTGSGNGLEHKASTMMTAPVWSTRKKSDYHRWLGLCAHEFFHTWNGKRLRPVELGPFDYENEVYTRSLWMVEGVTSYYAGLLLRRAGLITHKEYLDRLSDEIDDLQNTPGRTVQPLALSSYDAWIKYYRGDENSINSSISYYTKGALVAWLLDAEIRRRTAGKKSLDDAMRLAYSRFSGDKGYTPAELRAVFEEVAGEPLTRFWARYVDGTEELDYKPALEQFGLHFREPDKGADNDEPAGWLGADVGTDNVVRRIRAGTPAETGGLNVGDELLASDGFRIAAGGLADRLTDYRPGAAVALMVARRGRIVTLKVTLGKKPQASWKIETDDDSASMAARISWLGPDSDTDDGADSDD